jgi:transcriptional regulator with XRE-family HTH domain
MTITGKQIKEARIQAGLTQKEVADRLSVSQPTITNWEQGRTVPSAEKAKALTKFLDLPGSGPSAGAGSDRRPTEVSAFGVWLQRARSKKNLTIPELATRSGVSGQQIYNIETGRTENPRPQTRDHLMKALGESAPEEAIEATEHAAEIAGLGTLRDFNPHSDDDLPEEPGIYVFYDVSDRPIYVGESADIRGRIRDRHTGHRDKFWFKQPIVERAAYVRVDDKHLRKQIEQILIKFLKSNAVLNRQHVERE